MPRYFFALTTSNSSSAYWNLRKLFTSILNDHLKQHSDSNHIIVKRRQENRQGYSTLDHILLPKCVAERRKERGEERRGGAREAERGGKGEGKEEVKRG